jgi:hypothetical protein
MIYLYAVTGPLSARLDGSGLEGAPLEQVSVDGLTAIYSTHPTLEPRPDADSCWAHEHAVEAVMHSQTVLPARFGTTFDGLDELRTAVARDAPAMAERLRALHGCVELAVRIGPLTPEDQEIRDGRDYLLEKLSASRRREALADGTLACLRELAVAWTPAAQSMRSGQVSIGYLVRGDEVDRFVRAVGRLAIRWPEFALSCTGPWAPYSFAAGPGWPTSEPRSEGFADPDASAAIAEVV